MRTVLRATLRNDIQPDCDQLKVSHVPFLVRAGDDPFLDLSRELYSTSVQSAHDMAVALGELPELEGQTIKLLHSTKHGFHLKLVDFHDPLPSCLIPLADHKHRSDLLATSHELVAINSRIREVSDDCLLLSQAIIESLREQLARKIHVIHRAVDAVAMLDMIQSFANVAVHHQDYVRPLIREGQQTTAGTAPALDTFLALQAARHPLAEYGAGQGSGGRHGGTFVPHSIECSANQLVKVITGANNSGKTTLLRTVGSVLLLGQVGCFVPATQAEWVALDHLVMLDGTTDEAIKRATSNFTMEMQGITRVLRHLHVGGEASAAKPRSLVLADELGRSTSTADGTAVAWGVVEALAASDTMVMVTTHYMPLMAMTRMYPVVEHLRMRARVATGTTREAPGDMATSALAEPGPVPRLVFEYRLDRCPESENTANRREPISYGVALAAMMGFPSSILREATRIAGAIGETEAVTFVAPDADARITAKANHLFIRGLHLARQRRDGRVSTTYFMQNMQTLVDGSRRLVNDTELD
jgi:DNA mismatch repair ATPase MutS